MNQNKLTVQIPKPEVLSFGFNVNQAIPQESQLIFLEDLAPAMDR